jgi:hypothetical protein
MTKATDETTLALRLRKAGMRLERHGDHFQIATGNQIVIARGLDGKPLSLEQIDRLTAWLA